MQTGPLHHAAQITNVASVPHRSPFRYPGGKTWLVPVIRQWLQRMDRRPSLLIEPFAGGGIVGLTAAFERLVDHVVLIEFDPQVAVVWQTILHGEADWLATRILQFNMELDHVRTLLATPADEIREQAFRTIVRNRVSHGGILAPGASFVKNGENGKGIKSRWYAATLARRIRDIGSIRDRVTFVHGDGLEAIRQFATDRQAAFFIDPPYTMGPVEGKRAGARLYTHHELDHPCLFRLTAQVAGTFIMTYDDTIEVRALARQHALHVDTVAMKNTHHARMNELLISRDLSWRHPVIPEKTQVADR